MHYKIYYKTIIYRKLHSDTNICKTCTVVKISITLQKELYCLTVREVCCSVVAVVLLLSSLAAVICRLGTVFPLPLIAVFCARRGHTLWFGCYFNLLVFKANRRCESFCKASQRLCITGLQLKEHSSESASLSFPTVSSVDDLDTADSNLQSEVSLPLHVPAFFPQ